MFLKKEKAARRTSWVTLLDVDGAALNSCPAGEFALPEETVLQLSVEYFRAVRDSSRRGASAGDDGADGALSDRRNGGDRAAFSEAEELFCRECGGGAD